MRSVGVRRQLSEAKPLLQPVNPARGFALGQSRFESLRLFHLFRQPLQRGGLRTGHGFPPKMNVRARALRFLFLMSLGFRPLPL